MTDVVESGLVDGGLRYDAALARAIAASAPAAVCAVDGAGRTTFVNATACSLLGWCERDVLGRPVHDVLHGTGSDCGSGGAVCDLLSLLTTGEPGRVDDLVFHRHDGTPVTVSCSTAPIVVDGEVHGAVVSFLDVTRQREVERALRDEARAVETLHHIGQALSAELDLQRLVQAVTDAATLVTGAEFGSFVYNLADQHGEACAVHPRSGVPGAALEPVPMPPLQNLLEPAFHDEGVVRLDDATADPRYGGRTSAGCPQVRSYLAVPVVSRTGEVLGGLFFGHERAGVFDERDERLVVGIAAQAAIALDNARLYREAQEEIALRARAEQVQRFLADISTTLACSLDYVATAREVARLAVDHIADACIVDVIEDNGYRTLAVAHADPEVESLLRLWRQEEPPQPDVNDPIHRVVTSGTAEIVPVGDAESRARRARSARHREALDRVDATSVMVVPLVARGKVHGTVAFAASGGRPVFTQRDLALAEEFALRLGAAIDNARLFEERTRVARTLQESLLPPLLPDVPGVEIAARYRPAGAGNLVGGDFYDVFPDGAGDWAIVLGDVCGFGAEAAAITGIARYTIRAVALTEGVPSRVLGALNEAIVRQRDDERFCTAVYLRLRCEGDRTTVTWASGGHPPPLVLRRAGGVDVLPSPEGALLGLFAGVTLADAEVVLEPGDSLVLYTDGVIEARGEDGSLFGTEGLASLLRTVSRKSAQTVATGIEQGLRHFAPGALSDDMALLVVQAAPRR